MATFELGERIGSGGTGLVRRAIRTKDGAVVAIKSLSDAFVGDDLSLRRFKRGVLLQKRLLHANILPILDYYLEESPPFYVMPLASGTLEDAIRDGLTEDQ